jgi:hypothetical protein
VIGVRAGAKRLDLQKVHDALMILFSGQLDRSGGIGGDEK